MKKLLILLALAISPLPALAGTLKGRVILKNRDGSVAKSAANIVVYIKDVPWGRPLKRLSRKKRFEIAQENLQFTPRLTVATIGNAIDFPNRDKVFHNVFSLSRGNKFDLQLYKSGTSKAIRLKRPGVIDVYCNIHPQMVAKVLVLDTIFYARTRRDGRFKIRGVTKGTYDLIAWQPIGEPFRGKVTIIYRQTTEMDIEMVKGAKPKQHVRKDGTDYGRYQ